MAAAAHDVVEITDDDETSPVASQRHRIMNPGPLALPEKLRRARFTIFISEEESTSRRWLEKPQGLRYIIWSTEKCPSTGRFHIQGNPVTYLTF